MEALLKESREERARKGGGGENASSASTELSPMMVLRLLVSSSRSRAPCQLPDRLAVFLHLRGEEFFFSFTCFCQSIHVLLLIGTRGGHEIVVLRRGRVWKILRKVTRKLGETVKNG